MAKTLKFLFALACLCTVTLAAQTGKSTAPKASSAPKLMEDAVTDLRAYWTAERLASAKPMPIPAVYTSDVVQTSAPAPGPVQFNPSHPPMVQHPASAEVSSERFPLDTGEEMEADVAATPAGFNYVMPFDNYRAGNNTVFPHQAIGKIFFTIPAGASEPAGTYVCSGSVISDGRGNYGLTVVTARHCVFDTAKKVWYKNWVFYPGWNNGSDAAVGGAYYPEQVATWTSGSATVMSLTGGYDIAMMEMHDRGGTGCNGNKGSHPIGYYTGWLGWTYGGDYTQRQWNILGYPQAAPFEGNYLYNDEGATGAINPLGSSNVVEAGDPQTGGTSGGPWVIGFDPANGIVPNPNNNTASGYRNLANGVSSFKWTNPSHPYTLNGTVFQQANFYNLLTFMKTLTCS